MGHPNRKFRLFQELSINWPIHPRIANIGVGLTMIGTLLLVVEYFLRKWLWFNIPTLQFMHITSRRDDGVLVTDATESYMTFLFPIGILLGVFGFVWLLVTLDYRAFYRQITKRPSQQRYVPDNRRCNERSSVAMIDNRERDDPERRQIQQNVLDAIQKVWLKFPDWRFGQLLCAMAVYPQGTDVNIYDLDDQELLDGIQKFFESRKSLGYDE